MTTLVFGHQSPDTDSTGSPLIWAWYLTEVKGHTAEAVLLGEPSTEAAFMLERWGFETPRIIDAVEDDQKVVVVDTNNPGELVDLSKAEITAIIDHHRLAGGLETRSPVDLTIRPLACTATVMYDLMGADAEKMPDPIKGAMLSCILSDTLEFRSPTTTAHDREIAEKLADELGEQIPAYAAEMFAAKSDISAFSDVELIRMDSKKNEIDGVKLRVSVLETTDPETVLSRKDGLMAAMEEVKADEGIDEVLLFAVDILESEATLLVPNDRVRRIAEKSFSTVCSEDSVTLPGIVSRKKQIIPNLKV